MIWWQWLLMLVAVLVGGLLVLAGIVAAKVLRGEPLALRAAPPPKPTIRTAKEEKEIWREKEREAQERGYGKITMETLPPK